MPHVQTIRYQYTVRVVNLQLDTLRSQCGMLAEVAVLLGIHELDTCG